MIILEKNGFKKKVATGYSWKSLLFGVLYPASRGDIKGFIIQIVLALVSGGLSWLFVPFKYNKIYLDRLVSEGWALSKED
jgi:hypothetical protein